MEPETSKQSVTTHMTSNKTESKKDGWSGTLKYVGVAAVCLLGTGFAELSTRTPKIQEFGKVGEQFYADFTDPTLATGLEVFVFDSEAVKARQFQVARQENGRWVIPSHHDYPADAAERLAKTASSIIGIERGAMITRWSADHGRYGVVNPKQDSLNVEDVAGVGQRVILKKDDDSVLADYIIGKEVEGQSGEYYVRHPKEDEVYIAKLEIDLSTSFTDWIDDKLFTFSNGDVIGLELNDYAFDEISGTMTERVVTTLSRDEAWGENWELDPPLDVEKEEINKPTVQDALTALADLEVIGVRPKQKGLTPDLKVDNEFIKMQQQFTLMQQDLLSRGFLLQPGDTEDSLSMISREGELIASTANGIRYQLYFGRVFTGSQEELEIGFGDSTEDTAAEDAAAKPDETTDADSEANDASKPGRYLFVRVAFDENLLEGPKSQPLEPQKSARQLELEEAEKSESEEAAEEGEEKSEDDSADKEAEEKKEPTELEKLRQEYDLAQQQYKTDQRDFESRNEKIEEGKKQAEELNRRFAEWYYVIPGASFEKLGLARTDLIKEKESEETTPAAPVTGPGVIVPEAPPLESQTPNESTETATTTEEAEEPAVAEEPNAASGDSTSAPEPAEGQPISEPDPTAATETE